MIGSFEAVEAIALEVLRAWVVEHGELFVVDPDWARC